MGENSELYDEGSSSSSSSSSSWWKQLEGQILGYISALKRNPYAVVLLFFFTFLLIGGFFCFFTSSDVTGNSFDLNFVIGNGKSKSHQKVFLPLNCSGAGEELTTCRNDYPTTYEPLNRTSKMCPDYFRWIYEDLRPWKSAGITRDTLRKSKEKAATFGLTIVKGRLYVEKFRGTYQTRNVFTIWGILQLLRMYPGKVPDLELMFWCEDLPAIEKRNYKHRNLKYAPPVFHYCGHESNLDIVFPDWSFWGWPEVNIKPWTSIMKDIKEGNNKTLWKDRVPYAYWRGNPYVSSIRGNLMKCNSSQWNALLYKQEWNKEIQQGFKNSNLADQCTHRFKIYIEGRAWSVSEKYIMACDSMTLLVKPEFFDFFVRGMVPMKHYWPINPSNKCRDIKFAVDWGNNHTDKAQAIANEGSGFMRESLKMEYVYDYMLHVLREYAKLLKFKPKVPPNARQVCAESMACKENGMVRQFMEDSIVNSPSDQLPCTLPPPYDPSSLRKFLLKKQSVNLEVQKWEKHYWENLHKKQ